MDAIKNWFRSHSISAHTITSVWIAADALWYTNKDFKDYVWGIYIALPRPIHGIIAGVILPALIYWQARAKLRSPQS